VAEAQPPRNVKLGRILGAVGLRGWLKVQSYTDPPEGLLRHQRWELRDADGASALAEVAEAQSRGGALQVRFAGVEDRDRAEAFRGREIEVPRSALPPTMEREYYREDLVGLRVRNRSGQELGRASHFLDAPAGAVLVVKGARELWVPAVPRHLVHVDLERGEIEVDWPAEI
jgi:16S rRNA processing protein RimM